MTSYMYIKSIQLYTITSHL